MKCTARAPAKLVLFGEYAVLEDAPAIVAAVNRCATVTLETDRATSVDSDLGSEAGAAWFEAWKTAAGHARLPDVRVHLGTAALFADEVGTKLGLGSSAALTVAMGAALRRIQEERMDPVRDFAEDLATHRRLQGGAGSGIDVAASFHGGVLAWRKNEQRVESLALPADLEFACVWTGASASTSALIERVRAYQQAKPTAYAACLERMSALACEARDAFRAGSAGGIAALACAYHDAMADLGAQSGAPIVTDAHRRLAEIAGSSEVGYKPSGAGGGDVGILFSASGAALAGATERCRAEGFQLVDLRIHELGVAVSTDEGSQD